MMDGMDDTLYLDPDDMAVEKRLESGGVQTSPPEAWAPAEGRGKFLRPERKGETLAIEVPITIAKAGFDPSQARDEGGQWTDGGGTSAPRVFKTPDDVKTVRGWGDETTVQWKDKPGSLVTGRVLNLDTDVPDTLYHVTVAGPAVRESGMLLGQLGDKGLGGGQESGVSFTSSRSDAAVIERELRRAVGIAKGNLTIEDIPKFAAEDERQAGLAPGTLSPASDDAVRTYKINDKNYRSSGYWRDKYPDGPPESTIRSLVKDAHNAYLSRRDTIARNQDVYDTLKNPILFGRQEELAKIDPDHIEAMVVPKSAVPRGALVTSGSDDFLHEVRVYADVPVERSARKAAGPRLRGVLSNWRLGVAIIAKQDGDSSSAPAFASHTFVVGTLKDGEWVRDRKLRRVNPYEALFLRRGVSLAKAGFDPSQARDEGGQWTDGGGGGGASGGASGGANGGASGTSEHKPASPTGKGDGDDGGSMAPERELSAEDVRQAFEKDAWSMTDRMRTLGATGPMDVVDGPWKAAGIETVNQRVKIKLKGVRPEFKIQARNDAGRAAVVLARLPQEHFDRIKKQQITVALNYDYDEAMKNTNGQHGAGQKIEIFMRNTPSLETTLVHEMGHARDAAHIGLLSQKRFGRAVGDVDVPNTDPNEIGLTVHRPGERVSRYARKSDVEAFAEAYAMYAAPAGRAAMAVKFPKTHAYMKALFEGGQPGRKRAVTYPAYDAQGRKIHVTIPEGE